MVNTRTVQSAPEDSAFAVKTPPIDALAEASEAVTVAESQNGASDISTPPPANDPKAALAARMARFQSLQATNKSMKKRLQEEINKDKSQEEQQAKQELLNKNQSTIDQFELKILKDELGDKFERKRAMDYSAAEAEEWDNRQRKKQKNRNNVAFSDWQAEAHKNYKRQLRNLGKTDLNAYLAEKAQKLQDQVTSGLLELVETEDGDVFTVDKLGRVNTPVDEAYTHGDHKPSKDAVDRLVADLDKAERARLKARAARGLNDDDKGDVTYINQKNKQFNDKLARFYNRYTTEIRESFERGTAI